MKYKRGRLIHLHHLRNVTRKILGRMLQVDPTLRQFYKLSPKAMMLRLNISLEKATAIYHEIRDDEQNIFYKNNLKNIQTITIYDAQYPSLLKYIYDPPIVLYCLGNVELLKMKPSVSVIGTRKPSREGPQKVHFILAPLIHHNWTVVSGLAYGIDRIAHEITLQYGGNTIAVLGSGFHHLYPAAHAELFNKIREKGLVISEYPPHVKARKHHFPERNRIVSGLTEATLVIEAEKHSGTNITVDHALEQGREVYAVPGSILSSQTRGCHHMIQEGAKLVMHANDILEDFQSEKQLSFYS